MKKTLWICTFFLVIASFFSLRDFDSRYHRSINGDGKGYYAYLPALFIYHDSNYEFIDRMEKKYYPEDGSHSKDFLNEQVNGKFVNKCFPGLTVLYTPFFLIATLFSWLLGLPVDGYSVLFQLSIGLAHLFYFFLGLHFLYKYLASWKFSTTSIWTIFLCLIFGTNCWYYLIYDHTVSHIFIFFLVSLYIYLIKKWMDQKTSVQLAKLITVLCLLIIVRPTNAMMVLFLPFLFQWHGIKLFPFLRSSLQWKKMRKYLPVFLVILAIPPLLWKWQSDLWLVYSYNDEGFHFLSPNWFNFLFSYKKGWLLWTPLLFLFLLCSTFSFLKKSFLLAAYYLLPFVIYTYVLSSWWCWTYGAGMGQRTMIDLYPFLAVGMVFFLEQLSFKKTFSLLFIPFIGLNLLQCYQIQKSILAGGETDSISYWNHFLQWKTDPPTVHLNPEWKLVASKTQIFNQHIDADHPYSLALDSDSLSNIKTLVVTGEIGGKHGDPSIVLVVSSLDGKIYQSFYFGDYLYQQPRIMSVQFNVPFPSKQVYRTYLWNGNSKAKASVHKLKIDYYTY
jgi:hypothetical protein